ncbi:hypothetical protein, partial [Pseudomonas shirazica]|uniref:hypothetical protein n=1 Tax=Pseudomonas shirazica TaxID=1940636 RepID=UPI0019603B6C
ANLLVADSTFLAHAGQSIPTTFQDFNSPESDSLFPPEAAGSSGSDAQQLLSESQQSADCSLEIAVTCAIFGALHASPAGRM